MKTTLRDSARKLATSGAAGGERPQRARSNGTAVIALGVAAVLGVVAFAVLRGGAVRTAPANVAATLPPPPAPLIEPAGRTAKP